MMRLTSHALILGLAVVLAGGRGSRLGVLTDWRTKPAVPFAGKFRIIDFTLSNCVNSDIRKAIQQGAAREDIVAGLIFSVVSNYLNRVSGNRRIGNHVFYR